MAPKKALFALLTIAPLATGTIFAFILSQVTIEANNQTNQSSETKNLGVNVSTNYKMLELSGEDATFFNGQMPLSPNQVIFINQNNNGVSFADLQANYLKNAKVLVTETVKKEIIDNYYLGGRLFNNATLEFRAFGKTVKYPQEALALIDPNDQSSYQRANLKIIELWRQKKFQFPWEIVTNNAEIVKPFIFPQPMEHTIALTEQQLQYFNGTYPLSPDQISFINRNNDQWSFPVIQKAIAEKQTVFVTSIVKQKIIEQYFISSETSFFNNVGSQIIWNGRAVAYPPTVSWLDEPEKRGQAIIKLWQAGQFKLPWEQGAQLVKVKPNLNSNQQWWVTNFKQLDGAPNPNSKEVENSLVTTERIYSEEIFGYKTEGSDSYRIPGIIKGSGNKIFINADKRLENSKDFDNNISQVFSVSNDNGQTWSLNEDIISIETPKTKRGLIIDGTMVDAKYQENGQIKSKLIYLFNIFAENAGIPHLQKGTPWVNVDGVPYLKIWFKINNVFDNSAHVLKELPNKPGWWRMYTLPIGIKHDQFTSASQLTATQTYVDNSYDSVTRKVSGRVYENVLDSEIANPLALEVRKTNHSIWDAYVSSTKYYLAKNNHNATLESYDEGKTWTNFQLIDWQIKFNPNTDFPFAANAVGMGLQLRHQTGANAHLNGRIIYPMYNYNNVNRLQSAYYIYSDDFGKTWKAHYLTGLRDNSSESSMVESADGTLNWIFRFANRSATNQPSITKSIDGGQNWIHPVTNAPNPKFMPITEKTEGNVFIGMGAFRLKGEDFLIFSTPRINYRKAGSMYIMKQGSSEIHEIWNFDITNQEDFGYSYTISIAEQEDYVEVLVIYEWSPKTKMNATDKFFNERPQGGGIQLDKFRITRR